VVRLPRLVIAAPASGAGKTTVATGLMAAFRARGLSVSGHKAGPDYIDPGYHAIATGRPGRNLDPFLCGDELIGPLFARGALHPAGADIAVIEGVMGLFDGIADGPAAGLPADFASTAHVARLLHAPVVLVVDAARAGRSVAALIAGFAGFDPRVPVAGVIFNRVGSDRHERMLREALDPSGIPVFGAIRRTDALVTPSRHLGLVPAAERLDAARRAVGALGAVVADSCDLPGLRALAASAPPLPVTAWDPAAALGSARPAVAEPPAAEASAADAPRGDGPGAEARAAASPGGDGPGGDGPGGEAPAAEPVVAVAQGPAFTFSYTEHAELLEAAGARVAPFDPLADEALPPGTSGLVIGGGFPEVHAAQLSANAPLRGQVRALAASGAPVVAECAGLLYLARTLDGQPMCGVIGADTRMTERLTLGYRSAEAASDSVLARRGEHMRGHEFHRTAADPQCGPAPAWRFPGVHDPGGEAAILHPIHRDHENEATLRRRGRTEGHVHGKLVASYLHVHWASRPEAARRFVAGCRPVKLASGATS
jgi:cobyrinic acid a,c-diamide synthase